MSLKYEPSSEPHPQPPILTQVFKGPEFVLKHLWNKHSSVVRSTCPTLLLLYYYPA